MTKKITLATIKSFIRKNANSLYIQNLSKFDVMVDGVRSIDSPSFRKAEVTVTGDLYHYTLGVMGAWFVRDSRDYFSSYNQNGFVGYEISNCCGSFVLAVKAE